MKQINKNLWYCLLIVLISLVCYSNILFMGFFQIDDVKFVIANARTNSFSSIPKLFANPSFDNLYRPVRETFYTLAGFIFGDNPIGYHLLSILVFLGIVITLYFIVFKLIKHSELALITGALFASAPIHVERVAWITASMDLIAILFMLLGFLLYIKYTETKSIVALISSLILFLASVFGNEECIMFFPIILLYDLCFLNEGNFLNALKTKLKKPVVYIIMILISCFYLFVRFRVLQSLNRFNTYAFTGSFLGNMINQPFITVKAIYMTINPAFITFVPEINIISSIFNLQFILPIIVLILIVLFAIWVYKRDKVIFFCIGWFFITYLPFMNFLKNSTLISGRYLFVPSFGIILLISYLIVKVYKYYQHSKNIKRIIIIALCLLIILSGIKTVYMNSFYPDSVKFGTEYNKINPSSGYGYYIIGNAYAKNNEYEQSLFNFNLAVNQEYDKVTPCIKTRYYAKILKIHSIMNNSEYCIDIGNMVINNFRYCTDTTEIYYIVGRCYASLNRLDLAEEYFYQSHSREPDSIQYELALSVTYDLNNKPELAFTGYINYLKSGNYDHRVDDFVKNRVQQIVNNQTLNLEKKWEQDF